MMFDDDGSQIAERVEKLVVQIEKTAKQQHLTGKRRESFVDAISLCGSCKYASIRRRSNKNERQMKCAVFEGPCPEDITECTEYATLTSLSLGQMAEMAHLIGGQEAKRVGFVQD